MKRIILTCSLLLCWSLYIFCQSANEQTPTIEQMVKRKNFTISIERMLPSVGENQLVSNFSLRVLNDSVFCDLPYYGKIYQMSYRGQDDLVFERPLHEYKITEKKQHILIVKFLVRKDGFRHEFTIECNPDGRAYIMLRADNRSPIQYEGFFRWGTVELILRSTTR